MNGWENTGRVHCRFMTVIIPSAPVKIDIGSVLGMTKSLISQIEEFYFTSQSFLDTENSICMYTIDMATYNKMKSSVEPESI